MPQKYMRARSPVNPSRNPMVRENRFTAAARQCRSQVRDDVPCGLSHVLLWDYPPNNDWIPLYASIVGK
jgi:hypothetical protein